MEEQKFKRGNLVEILFGHACISFGDEGQVTTDMSPEQVGRLAIIEYSYAEKFGGEDTDSYSIIFVETGSSLAWKQTREMRFIDEGGEHLFDDASKVKEKIKNQNTDLNYIVSNLDKGELSSDSILVLFDLLGFRTSFLKNGEFFALFSDWSKLHPVFLHIKNAKTLKDAKSVFKPAGLKNYNVEKVFNEFKSNIK